MALVLGWEWAQAAVATQQRRAQGGEARVVDDLVERHHQVVEKVAPAAVVEVDRVNLAVVEQVVLLVQVAVDEAEGARLAVKRLLRVADLANHGLDGRHILWLT